MAAVDIESNNNMQESTSVQQNSTTKFAPIDDASSAHEHSHSCNDPSHHHDDFPSFFDQNDLYSSLAGAKKEAPTKRKSKKNQPKQGAIRAEAIPGHRGDQNIDDLMNFINSPPSANDKKQKKKSTTTTTTN